MQETVIRFRVKLLVSLCVALALASILTSSHVSAQVEKTGDGTVIEPTLQIAVATADTTRLNFWTPTLITLSNNGPDFSGDLAVTTFSSQNPTGPSSIGVLGWSYRQAVSLRHGAQKEVTINVPFYESTATPRGIIASLLNAQGKVVAFSKDQPTVVDPGSVMVGILADQTAQNNGFTPLSAATLPDPARSLTLVQLDATSLPDTAETLAPFDILILDNFPVRMLSAAQISALRTWVNRGGALIEIGGQQTLGALPPQLLPVLFNGTTTLPAGANVLPVGGPDLTDIGQKPVQLTQPVPVSSVSLPPANDARRQAFSSLSSVLSSGNLPLMVQANSGQGIICFLAYDPASAPLLAWPGTVALWKGLLLRSLRDQALFPATATRLPSGPGALNLRGGLFNVLQPGTLLPVWALIFLLLGYIVLIGPVRMVLLKLFKRPAWSWRIVLATAVVFSLLTYLLAFNQRSAIINSISLVQFDQGGQTAHVTTFFSVLVPGQGDVQVQVPGEVLAQPIVNQPFQVDERVASDSYHMAFTAARDGTTIDLPDAGGWTLHPLVSEGDQQVQGAILAHLSLAGGSLVGTVTNTLASSLSDVYILMPHGYASIGQLPAGQTLQVKVPLHITSLNASATLADQIARDNHLPVPYFPYSHNSQPQSAFQRHLAMLSALSGEGYAYANCNGPCSTHAVVTAHTITTPPFGSSPVAPLDSNDALLISGAPATLIGWADQPLGAIDNANVNGHGAGGTHDSLVQVPLNIDSLDPASLPPGLISGQVVNATGSNLQMLSPGIYNLSSGSITFDFTLPDVNVAQIHNMSIAEPFFNGTGTAAQVQLYNWASASWNTIALSGVSFSTGNTGAYLSSDGHVLLRVGTNLPASGSVSRQQSASPGALLFEKPALSFNA